jgi:hypothetical protein
LALFRLEKTAFAATDPGGDFDSDIWQLSGLAGSPVLARVPRINYAEGVRFHPHGIGLLPGALERLFVVNHAFQHGGERIDVFDIHVTADNTSVSLHYLYAVELGAAFSNTVNDVSPLVCCFRKEERKKEKVQKNSLGAAGFCFRRPTSFISRSGVRLRTARCRHSWISSCSPCTTS